MLSLEKIATEYMKSRLREEFMQMVLNLLNPTGNSDGFSEDVDIDVTDFDFDNVFCQVLRNNGIKHSDVGFDLFNFVICDVGDEPNDKYMKFICSILRPYHKHSGVYMKFLEFVVKRGHTLAKMVFRHPEFDIAYCLIYSNFSIEDFKRIAAWDLRIGSDIFRNSHCPVLSYACGTVLIENSAFEKMKHLEQLHGPDIMLWTADEDDQTNVNIFLRQGYIMNTEKRHQMKQKLHFMIDSCPTALKKTCIRHGSNENAFTIVLDRCHYDTGAMKKRNYAIVHNVFKHLLVSDLYTQYNERGHTLLDLVKSSTNTIVKAYIQCKFDIDLRYAVEAI